MRLLMVSGDRQVAIGERGPFHSMQREFSRYFERIDVLCPRPPGKVTTTCIHENVHFHPADCGRRGMVRFIAGKGAALIRDHGHELITSHDYGWFYNGLGSRTPVPRDGRARTCLGDPPRARGPRGGGPARAPRQVDRAHLRALGHAPQPGPSGWSTGRRCRGCCAAGACRRPRSTCCRRSTSTSTCSILRPAPAEPVERPGLRRAHGGQQGRRAHDRRPWAS